MREANISLKGSVETPSKAFDASSKNLHLDFPNFGGNTVICTIKVLYDKSPCGRFESKVFIFKGFSLSEQD